MPRKPRDLVEGGVYHVYARGNDRQTIFRDDRDRRLYLSILDHVVRVKRWRCIAYCLMGNHVHLLLETRERNLDTGMQLLHGLYGRKHNVRHGRSGHLFQGRYGAGRLRSNAQLERTLAYIEQALKKDSDGDGLSDGVEDKNRNGRRDPGETGPLKTDTDGDGFNDKVDKKPLNKNQH